jgi:hypothetical protein
MKRHTKRYVEHQIQAALLQWLKWEQKRFPELAYLYHVPNEFGRKITPAQAGRIKALGCRSGVPDLCLPVPRGKFAGLYMEIKAPDGELTPAQRDFLQFLSSVGYATSVCRTAPEARDRILSYLNLPKPEEKPPCPPPTENAAASARTNASPPGAPPSPPTPPAATPTADARSSPAPAKA